jgi:hypothetical protein
VTLARCPLCRVGVRDDNMLMHRERVHPRELTHEESAILSARDSALVRKRPNPPTKVLGTGLPAAPRFDENSPSNWTGPTTRNGTSSAEALDWLASPRVRARAPYGIPQSLWYAVRMADQVLFDKCGDRLLGEDEEEVQLLFAQHCESLWSKQAVNESDLKRARERLYDADLPQFRKKFEGGLEQRWIALAEPLALLQEAGEKAVPHLAMALSSDSWASILAARALGMMPSAPLRDRAMVDGLFLPGDWVPEASEGAVPGIPPDNRWPLFESVAKEAQAAGIELQSVYWTALYEERSEDVSEPRSTPQLGRAALILYDLGHHSALVAGLGFLLDPAVYGHERVERNLGEGGIAVALQVIAGRAPEHFPNRGEVEAQ